MRVMTIRGEKNRYNSMSSPKMKIRLWDEYDPDL